ncbi:MAG: hypothetical protein JXK93_02100 [Sphaerochaetaceae bacterium]|nr:hypothetical protein [Sphaerochaetaceae bacterium]
MIVRLTAGLAEKIDEPLEESLPLDDNPFADWTARLFRVKRVQHILITNTASLFSTMIYGEGIRSWDVLFKRLLHALREFLADEGYRTIYDRLIVPSISEIRFCKTLNRNVTGSMNDLVFMAGQYLADGMMTLTDASIRLNEMPLSYLDHSSPKMAFDQMRID